MRSVTAFLFALLLAGPATAQYAERLDVWVANVDVVVTDREGKPVHGLTRDDFEVYEDGKLQEITNFSTFESTAAVPSAPGTQAVSQPEAQDVARRRLFILYVDLVDIEPASRRRFFDGLRAFLDSSFRDGDMMTVLTWNHRLRVALGPTSSRAAIDAMIKALSSPYGRRDALMVEEIREQQIRQAREDAELAAALGLGIATDPDAEAAFQEWLRSEEQCAEVKRKIIELRNLLSSLSRVEVQKVLLFASDNAPISWASRGGRKCVLAEGWKSLADTANAYGITIHAFHPPGTRDPGRATRPDRGNFLPGSRDSAPGSGEQGRTFEESGGLVTVAKRTGGVTGLGPNDSSVKLAQAARELEAYYSIGYHMRSGNEDTPRKLKVVAKNPKYRVRARESVVRPSESTRIRDTVVTNLYLEAPAKSASPAFTAVIPRVTPDGRFRLVHVEVRVPVGELALLEGNDGKRRGSFSLFIATGREFGDASEVSELKHPFEVPPGTDVSKEIVYTIGVKVRPDTRRMSIAMRDDTTGEIATTVIPMKLQ